MSPLADLQRAMVSAILHDDRTALPALAAAPVPADAAFAVHRDTVVGGLTTALRLTFPTIEALVGGAFFDQAAGAYIAEQPPVRANLSAYGETFADFLDAYPHAASLPYLADVARLDLAIAKALRSPDLNSRREWPIEPAIGLSLPASLEVLDLRHPADLIRAGLEAADDAALAAIDLGARPRHLAVWRSGREAVVLLLSPPAGAFLATLISGGAPHEALSSAVAHAESNAALLAIQAEVFAASFAQIIQTALEESQP